ncbi:DUF2252 domain-containing protein [Solirubrobacter soli]|uniref:DUF2252 domain-containing protein n=1 Tax=Solirubrobacter soli TaxID=363832 RepID=UPI00041C57E3|nr:DUF2252 domain-containing protein [Solirubrobacter soli]
MSTATASQNGPASDVTEVGRGRAQAGRVEHFTRAERAARGKAARVEVPRSSHAGWEPAPGRRDPVDVLEEQAQTRVPELVPIRYGRMLVSPFTFYRGGAALMAADLAASPRTGLQVQLCGDAHLSNFGAFAAPDRRLVFGVNDFDESLPGPFEWDVKRLAASFAVAGRDRGFDAKQRGAVNLAVGRSYREAIRDFARMRALDLWYARLDVDDAAKEWVARATAKQRKRLDRNLAKARTKDSMRAFDRLTRLVDGEPRIVSDPPLIVPIEELVSADASVRLEDELRRLIRSYRRTLTGDRRHLLERFRYVHAARKVVGVGSVGTRAWIVLLLGNDDADPLFLQIKEAQRSVLEPHLGKSAFTNHGQRVVEGQRLMQAASDIMLGWLRTPGIDGVQRDFYIRQLWDGKGSAIVEAMEPDALATYANICGWTLARAHARSGDSAAIASYLGSSDSFDRAMASFAETYADQNDADYAALRRAADTGRIAVETGL